MRTFFIFRNFDLKLTLVLNFFLKLCLSVDSFPSGSVVKESACNAGAASDPGSIPGSGRSPGRKHGNPLQYSCLENAMDREPSGLQSTVAKSWT